MPQRNHDKVPVIVLPLDEFEQIKAEVRRFDFLLAELLKLPHLMSHDVGISRVDRHKRHDQFEHPKRAK